MDTAEPSRNTPASQRVGYHTFLLIALVFVLPTAVHQLNIVSILDIPLGYYVAAQGCLIALTILTFRHWMACEKALGKDIAAAKREPGWCMGSIALGLDWLMGVAFFVSVGAIFAWGYDGLSIGLGLMAGLAFHAIVVGKVSASQPDANPQYASQYLLGSTAECPAVRFAFAVVVLCCGIVALTAMIQAAAPVLSLIIGGQAVHSVAMAAGAVLLATAISALQPSRHLLAAAGLTIVSAFCAPAVWIAFNETGLPLPQFVFGGALKSVSELQQTLLVDGLADPVTMSPYLRPFTQLNPVNFFAFVACIMLGSAVFPRASSAGASLPAGRMSADIARRSAWAALLVLLVLSIAPPYAAFAKKAMFSLIHAQVSFGNLPDWIFTLSRVGLLEVCGAAVETSEAVRSACQAGNEAAGMLRLQDISLRPDAVWLTAPLMAGLPIQVLWLVASAGLAGILIAAARLLRSMSEAVYPQSTHNEARATLVTAIVSVAAIALAALCAWIKIADLTTLMAWSLSLAAAGLAPVIILTVWRPGAVRGFVSATAMLVGLLICVGYILGTHVFAPKFDEHWSEYSSAPPYAFEMLGELKQKCAVTQVAPPSVALPNFAANDTCRDYVIQAQKIANLWGIKNLSAAIFAFPVAGLILLLGLLFPPRNRSP